MQKEDGSGNFNAFNDGHPCNHSTAVTGYSYARGLIDYANDRMDVNPPLNLAPGSALTPIPKRIQWVLDGVYFDQDTVFRQGVGPNSSPIHDYAPLCINADSVINIFITEEWKWPYLKGLCQADPAVTTKN